MSSRRPKLRSAVPTPKASGFTLRFSTLQLGAPPKPPPLRLTDLPNDLLAETLGKTGSAADMCAAVYALVRSAKQFRDMSAWIDIAAKYNMPGEPVIEADATAEEKTLAWRKWVMGWCNLLRPSFKVRRETYLLDCVIFADVDAYNNAIPNSAFQLLFSSYRWLVLNSPEQVPPHLLSKHLWSLVLSTYYHHGTIEWVEFILGRFPDPNTDLEGHHKLLRGTAKHAAKQNKPELAIYLLDQFKDVMHKYAEEKATSRVQQGRLDALRVEAYVDEYVKDALQGMYDSSLRYDVRKIDTAWPILSQHPDIDKPTPEQVETAVKMAGDDDYVDLLTWIDKNYRVSKDIAIAVLNEKKADWEDFMNEDALKLVQQWSNRVA